MERLDRLVVAVCRWYFARLDRPSIHLQPGGMQPLNGQAMLPVWLPVHGT
jgi:hypothetical protein